MVPSLRYGQAANSGHREPSDRDGSVPLTARTAIHSGDLNSLKRLIERSSLHLSDCDARGRNLLDLTLEALQMVVVINGALIGSPISSPNIVRNGLWLLSKSLAPSQMSMDTYLPGWVKFANMKVRGLFSDTAINEMGIF